MKKALTQARNSNIDHLRGCLMLLVVIGHIVLGSVHENTLRYIIYAFHMPLFIGLSGYLINREKLYGSALADLISRYWWRIVLPFIFAFVFYTGVLLTHAYQEGRLTTSLLLSYLYTPYYHLWFVPTLVIWVGMFWLMLKQRLAGRWAALVFLVLTGLWATLSPGELPIVGPYIGLLLSKKVVYFFGFFLFGAWCNTKSSAKLMKFISSFNILPAAIVMLCAVVYIVNIGPDKELAKGLAWMMMNLGLIAIAVAWIGKEIQQEYASQDAKKQLKKIKTPGLVKRTLVAMGRISLPIYLWHVVPMFLLKGFGIHLTNPFVYYAVSIVAVGLIIAAIISLENKSRVLNRVVYGV